jgi:hypothetical protein
MTAHSVVCFFFAQMTPSPPKQFSKQGWGFLLATTHFKLKKIKSQYKKSPMPVCVSVGLRM